MTKSPKLFQWMPTLFLGASLLLLSGCATTAPQAKFTQALAPASRVAAGDETKVVVTAQGEAAMLDVEKSRLAQRIEQKVGAKKLLNPANPGKAAYEIEVVVTRYEKGNAFARAMLAGLGQIHVDGLVSLFTVPERKKVGEFAIKKTFAWGGLYGGTTTMEDVEIGFADGIAATLTGQKEDAPKDKATPPSAGDKPSASTGA